MAKRMTDSEKRGKALNDGGFCDVLSSPPYRGQRILVVMIDGYAHAIAV
jgi:hypothetical protein